MFPTNQEIRAYEHLAWLRQQGRYRDAEIMLRSCFAVKPAPAKPSLWRRLLGKGAS